MKPFRRLSLFAVALLLCSAITAAAAASASGEGFGVKEYEDFHHLLHELQHDALPKKDFPRIRSKSGELVKLGEAIVRLGVPDGIAAANVDEFKQALRNFSEALVKFSAAAKGGNDEQLKVSYSAVHNSFETLADLLPRKS